MGRRVEELGQELERRFSAPSPEAGCVELGTRLLPAMDCKCGQELERKFIV